MLSGRRILLVEDEPLTALHLAEAIETAQGTVVGPARRVVDAMRAIEADNIDAAILDRTLLDGKATSVAVKLIDLGIPFIFYSGSDPNHLRQEFPAISTFQKPTDPIRLIRAIEALVADHGD
jgi:DNA-binding response OmpR family regulator